MERRKEREREGEVRAFKSKTPPLLVDTTVLFPPKKVKGEGRGRFRFAYFFLVFRYLDLRLLCFSLFLFVYPLSALILVCSTNVERTREASNPSDTLNWLLHPRASNVFFFLKMSFKSLFDFSSMHSWLYCCGQNFLQIYYPLFCSNQMLTLIKLSLDIKTIQLFIYRSNKILFTYVIWKLNLPKLYWCQFSFKQSNGSTWKRKCLCMNFLCPRVKPLFTSESWLVGVDRWRSAAQRRDCNTL